MEDIVIVGAGGFGREVEWLINRLNQNQKKFNIIGYVDDNKEIGTKISELEVICNVEGIRKLNKTINVAVAIGNSKVRKRSVEKMKKMQNVEFPNLIDPSVIIDEKIIKGEGNIICAGTIATVDIEIKNFNIINLDCTIGHDVKICDFVTIYPSVNVSGNVLLNDCVEVGTGTQIIQGKTIGKNTIIGAGSVVIRDIEENVTAVGVPTRILAK